MDGFPRALYSVHDTKREAAEALRAFLKLAYTNMEPTPELEDVFSDSDSEYEVYVFLLTFIAVNTD